MKLFHIIRFAGITILSLTIVAGCAQNNSENNTQGTNISATKNAEPRFYTTNNGVAIEGADPVAYFEAGKAMLGSEEYAYEWGNATWYFSSAENRDLFAANPQKYAPQYGGFCAWALGQGEIQGIDPNAWTIVDGKLYLNYNQSVRRTWERDIQGNITKANKNWPGILK